MFQKFNFDTEWAVKLISRITNDEDIPIEGSTIVKQVQIKPLSVVTSFMSPSKFCRVFYYEDKENEKAHFINLLSINSIAFGPANKCGEIFLQSKKEPC